MLICKRVRAPEREVQEVPIDEALPTMSVTARKEWPAAEIEDLVVTVASLRDTEEVRKFLRDICTLGEIEAMAHRWQVAQLVAEGLPYHEVAARTGASTATVTRVAFWLRHGEGGYKLALERRARVAAGRRRKAK